VHDTKAMSFLRFGIQPKLVDSRFRELLREEKYRKIQPSPEKRCANLKRKLSKISRCDQIYEELAGKVIIRDQFFFTRYGF
jgi:hypothetical protein